MRDHRLETRAERYAAKARTAVRLPFSIVTAAFSCDENLGYVVRAAACYGATAVHVIGSLPPPGDLKRLSGSTDKLVPIFRHPNCHEFLEWKRVNDADGWIVAAEMTEGSIPIGRFAFPPRVGTYIVVGHEELGVPVEILHHADAVVHVPMPGPAFCLNTAQAANVVAYEYVRQRLPPIQGDPTPVE